MASADHDVAARADPSSRVGRQPTVLVVRPTAPTHPRDEVADRELVHLLRAADWLPIVAPDPDAAEQLLREAPTDLAVVCLDDDPELGLAVVDRLRAGPHGERQPIVCLADSPDQRTVIEGFQRTADDVIDRTVPPVELVARLRTRLQRPSIPRSLLPADPVTGALTEEAFEEQLGRELERVTRGGRNGALGYVTLEELPAIEVAHGPRAGDELLTQVVTLIERDSRTLDVVGLARGVLGLLLPGTHPRGAQIRFERLTRLLHDHEFVVDGRPTRLTPMIGYTESAADLSVAEFEDRAWTALEAQAAQRDLHPTRWRPTMSAQPLERSTALRVLGHLRTPLQVTAQQVVLLGVPLVIYALLWSAGLDITVWVYLTIVVALLITSAAIIAESAAASRPDEPPDPGDGPRPLATAIIAAYLPNEAGTIVETVEAFLDQDYPDLQIILAYNTPHRLEVEHELEAIAARDPRFVPLAVAGSVSKAQNVNAALSQVRGEFVGMFDADHHPAPGSFERAWRWLADGAGVVQGHCVIRNGDANLVTRLVAAEFEVIYAVSHPGRARLHGFGIFGGSNGYWRTSLLQRIRMQGFMLTEDIDSSMRVLATGERIVSDPGLVSTELAPASIGALWNQRLRWAQGWSQVSLRHLTSIVGSSTGLRRRLGVGYLLGWRELYPWISLQIFPLLAFWWLIGDRGFDWFVPIFVVTSILTFTAGPVQAWFGWRLAHPTIGQNRHWFVLFFFSSLLFYTEVKNVIARTAHVKELMQDRQWKVTPRTADGKPGPVPGSPPPIGPESFEGDARTAEPQPASEVVDQLEHLGEGDASRLAGRS